MHQWHVQHAVCSHLACGSGIGDSASSLAAGAGGALRTALGLLAAALLVDASMDMTSLPQQDRKMMMVAVAVLPDRAGRLPVRRGQPDGVFGTTGPYL